MSPYDRVQRGLTFSKPDRVPIIFFPEWDFLADLAGYKVRDFLADVEKQLAGMDKFQERFPGAYAATSVYQPYASAAAFGCKISDPEDEIAAVAGPVIDKPEQVHDLQIPDPWEAPGTRDWFEKIQFQLDRGDQVRNTGEFGPFEIAGQIYGYDRLLLHLRKKPEIIKVLLNKVTEWIIRFQTEWAKLIGGRVAILFIADHVSGFMNRALIEQWFGPYHEKVAKGLQEVAGTMFYHSENRSDHFLDLIGEWGYTMFHGQDWAKGGVYATREALQHTKDLVMGLEKKYLLMGQVPGRDVMLREPDDEVVRRRIIENIQIYAPGSGYALSTGGGINRGTPLRRLDMMIELADQYGRYKTKNELYGPEEGLE